LAGAWGWLVFSGAPADLPPLLVLGFLGVALALVFLVAIGLAVLLAAVVAVMGAAPLAVAVAVNVGRAGGGGRVALALTVGAPGSVFRGGGGGRVALARTRAVRVGAAVVLVGVGVALVRLVAPDSPTKASPPARNKTSNHTIMLAHVGPLG